MKDANSRQSGLEAQATVENEMFNDPDYLTFLEAMALQCQCEGEKPCDGMLAGGICDHYTETE